MERIKIFKRSLKKFLRSKADRKNNAIVEGWYKSYRPLENYAFTDQDKSKIENRLRASIFSHLHHQKSYRLHWRLAAAAVILVSALSLFFFSQQQKTTENTAYLSSNTKTGVLKYLLLSDSTQVWLNSSSAFKYPVSFPKGKREVYLPEGEAFFHVKRDTSRPFTVHVGHLDVRVLGTSFNISNYRSLHHQTIIVNAGKVRVSMGKKILAELEKGKQIVYDRESGSYSVGNANGQLWMAWKDGKTVLKDAAFEELALVMKNWYGIELKSNLAEIKGYSYSLTIQRNISIEENLGMICKMQHTRYRKEGNVIELY